MKDESLFAVVHGRVQGVGYRYFVLRLAERHSLAGYVRNLDDGSVEVYAEGPRAALTELCAELARGPVAARVARVDARYGPARGEHRGFSAG
jgi:acylphosphatase